MPWPCRGIEDMECASSHEAIRPARWCDGLDLAGAQDAIAWLLCQEQNRCKIVPDDRRHTSAGVTRRFGGGKVNGESLNSRSSLGSLSFDDFDSTDWSSSPRTLLLDYS